MHKMIRNGVKDLTTKMYMMADDMGLINIESIYSNEMKKVCEKMGWITEAIPLAGGNVRRPLADVKESDEAIIVILEMPGVEKEDAEITVTDDELSVRAKKPAEPKTEDECMYKSERSYDLFQRTIKLPCAVKREEAQASMKNGLLTITLPKEIVTSRTRISVD